MTFAAIYLCALYFILVTVIGLRLEILSQGFCCLLYTKSQRKRCLCKNDAKPKIDLDIVAGCLTCLCALCLLSISKQIYRRETTAEERYLNWYNPVASFSCLFSTTLLKNPLALRMVLYHSQDKTVSRITAL